tara:strand:- start:2091 stop:2333 length:243 start_codon:yes stop_codon:yes gene_type:complete
MGYYDDVRDGLIPEDSPIHEQFNQLHNTINDTITEQNNSAFSMEKDYWIKVINHMSPMTYCALIAAIGEVHQARFLGEEQ